MERIYFLTLIMFQPSNHKIDVLTEGLFNSTLKLPAQIVRIPRQCHVYTSGDEDRMIYWIQRGHVKLVVDSKGGKECLLDIYSSGDFFGESCLAGLDFRIATATTMEDSIP